MPAKGRAAGAGRGAAVGAAAMVQLGLGLIPIGALVGGVAGAVKAPPRATVEEAEASLRTALAELKVQEAVRDQILQFAREHTSHPVVLLTEGGPGAPGEAVGYASLAEKGIDSVLEVSVQTVSLAGKWGVNPPVKLVMAVQTRLVRVSDGTVLYAFNPMYASTERRFTEWAIDAAAPFRDELDRAYRSLAESITEELFLLYVPEGAGRPRDSSPPSKGVVEQPTSE